jgi:hypothetical protein
MLQPIVSRHGSAWGEVCPGEGITELFEGCAVLQGHTHQAGDYIVKANQLRGAVRTFYPKEEFGRGGIVMDGDMQGSSGGLSG